jgi:UDP-N-acetylglucosamine 2-epimerase (non-hydrolysing)
MSAYAGTIAASSLGIPVAHVEAGLRSGVIDEPWPEERIRRSISLNAAWHFCPTERSRRNLWAEGTPDRRIFVTGNPVVSAMHRYADPTPCEVPENQILVTMHRREWTDAGRAVVLKTIFALFEQAIRYADIKFLWPMHPGVRKIGGVALNRTPDNVVLGPPLAYREAIDVLRVSLGVGTDSGGLCE